LQYIAEGYCFITTSSLFSLVQLVFPYINERSKKMTLVRISARVLEDLTAAMFVKLGFSSSSSRTIAQSLILADLRGVHSHGVMLVPIYVDRIQRGLVSHYETGEVVINRDAVAVIDGHHGMGQLIGRQGMQLAIEMAEKYGVSAVGVYHSHHFGAAAFYALMAVEQGCIGVATSNATPLMPAPGGAQPVVGTNPIAVAVPVEHDQPLVLDMALSQVAQGKIRYAANAGQPIPSNWATDASGKPTTDPEIALKGFLLPMGGPKGFGLSLIVDVLAGALLGGAWGSKVHSIFNDLKNPQDCGHFFLTLHINHFGTAATFPLEMKTMIQSIRGSRRAAGTERLFVPGEIEWDSTTKHSRDGIPLEPRVLADFARTAKELGVPVVGLDF
jgi:LDH2 family malate/lactate/ureidoglycolate dehydrogenase